jgi:hypothetical protein
MDRIPIHTIEDAPLPSRELLEGIVHSSPTGRPLNMQAQMADAPAVLASYVSLRRATEQHGTLEAKHRSAVMVVTASNLGVEYVEAMTSMLALRAGWTETEVSNLRGGLGSGDEKLDSLLQVVVGAAATKGRVEDDTWESAIESGWTAQQLSESFAYFAIALYSAYFVNFADTTADLPVLSNSRG